MITATRPEDGVSRPSSTAASSSSMPLSFKSTRQGIRISWRTAVTTREDRSLSLTSGRRLPSHVPSLTKASLPARELTRVTFGSSGREGDGPPEYFSVHRLLTRRTSVRRPTSRSKPAMGASLTRSTFPCLSILRPRAEPWRFPPEPTAAQSALLRGSIASAAPVGSRSRAEGSSARVRPASSAKPDPSRLTLPRCTRRKPSSQASGSLSLSDPVGGMAAAGRRGSALVRFRQQRETASKRLDEAPLGRASRHCRIPRRSASVSLTQGIQMLLRRRSILGPLVDESGGFGLK
mmetsp:Transcript_10678/g.25335  ORF Transcript_10678/g.25335 Transcript_10678/m.25335 type:complete len:292 (-) Transcript_10678:494-1369(-)